VHAFASTVGDTLRDLAPDLRRALPLICDALGETRLARQRRFHGAVTCEGSADERRSDDSTESPEQGATPARGQKSEPHTQERGGDPFRTAQIAVLYLHDVTPTQWTGLVRILRVSGLAGLLAVPANKTVAA
jgi:hypothetical protein